MSNPAMSNASPGSESSRYELAVRVGIEAIRQGKWQHAVMCFEAAKEGLPDDPRVYLGLGDAQLGMGDAVQAQQFYEQAARLNPREPIFLDRVAEARYRQGDMLEASRALVLAGDILWDRKEIDAAGSRWRRAAELRPEAPSAFERLAMLYRYEGNEAATIDYYLKLAETLRRQNRRMAALHVCTMALQMSPDNAQAQALTTEIWRQVAAHADKSPTTTPPVRSSDLVSAASELAQWQLTSAFRQSTLATPNPARLERNILLGQALLNEGRGRAGQAIECYEQVIAAGMQLPAVFYVLGLLYKLVGRKAEARAALTLASRDPFYRQAIALL